MSPEYPKNVVQRLLFIMSLSSKQEFAVLQADEPGKPSGMTIDFSCRHICGRYEKLDHCHRDMSENLVHFHN